MNCPCFCIKIQLKTSRKRLRSGSLLSRSLQRLGVEYNFLIEKKRFEALNVFLVFSTYRNTVGFIERKPTTLHESRACISFIYLYPNMQLMFVQQIH